MQSKLKAPGLNPNSTEHPNLNSTISDGQEFRTSTKRRKHLHKSKHQTANQIINPKDQRKTKTSYEL